MRTRMFVGFLSIGVLAVAASFGWAQYGGNGSTQGLNNDPNAVDQTQPSTNPSGTTDTGTPGVTGTTGDTGTTGATGSDMNRSSVSGLSDREIAGKVRQAIHGDQSLSSSAHNVKVTATNGRVSLKGNVASDADKDMIGSKAAEIVGSGNVDNNLTVK